MRIIVLLVATLTVGLQCGLIAASEPADAVSGDRDAGEKMVFDCLSGDRQIECLIQKGFRCAAVGNPEGNGYSCYVALEDGCYRSRFRLKDNGWSGSDSWLDGECDDTHEPVLQSGVRWRYDNTNAPVELVFQLFVGQIFSHTLDYFGNLDALEDEPHNMGFHYVEAGLTGNMESVDVVRYFAERYLDIEKEVEDLSRKLLCVGNKPRYEGAENFLIFNQLDDVQLHVYERHLFLARADLQASGLFDIDKALREYPGGFSSVSIDHEAARNGSVSRIYEDASRLCEKSWGHSFSVSGSSTIGKIESID